ncbi:MAG: cyclopropane-fatty-acyl-phospholipid synthase family protein [Pseudomonadota bacterium]
MTAILSDKRLSSGIQRCFEHLSETLQIPINVSLWGTPTIHLRGASASDLSITINDKGVVASLLKGPSLENLLRHYAAGNIVLEGSKDLITLGETLREQIKKKDLKRLKKSLFLKNLWPFLFVKSTKSSLRHEYTEDETGFNQKKRVNKDFIQFHYDVSNEFYQLFLDPEMQYSCGNFKNWDESLEQAQQNKLEMICRKLRLKDGERFLDIGCGWGGLVCYAAQRYGVKAHGVTLSQAQYDFAQEKVKRLGLEDKVTLEIRDYITLEGTYDKIASIGMFEHIGVDNFPNYFKKVRSLLRDNGLFLNHAIARRTKVNKKKSRRITPEKHLILKYIFPGSELAPIGDSVDSMEAYGFEIHDVEGWREHYALTCKHWCQRLSKNKDKAIKLIGKERYLMWVTYLAGVSFGFHSGTILIYQTLGSKRAKAKGLSELPPTRQDLYG